MIWAFFSRRGCDARELVDVGVVLSCSRHSYLVAASASEADYAVLGMPIALLSSAGAIMFAFYSNRVGCIGSIVVSLIGTAILAALMWSLSVH
jgi:hypothetical protein